MQTVALNDNPVAMREVYICVCVYTYVIYTHTYISNICIDICIYVYIHIYVALQRVALTRNPVAMREV